MTGEKRFRTVRHGFPVFIRKTTKILFYRCENLVVFVGRRIFISRRMLHALPHMQFVLVRRGSCPPRDANASRASHIIICHYCSLMTPCRRRSAGSRRAPDFRIFSRTLQGQPFIHSDLSYSPPISSTTLVIPPSPHHEVQLLPPLRNRRTYYGETCFHPDPSSLGGGYCPPFYPGGPPTVLSTGAYPMPVLPVIPLSVPVFDPPFPGDPANATRGRRVHSI